MALLKTEYACPTCKRLTGKSVQIVASAGELSCPSGHKWNDTMEFLQLGPAMEFKVAQIVAEQTNRTPFTVPIPINLKKDLEKKYGSKLAPTVTAILNQLNEGSAMMIPQTDIERLADRLGAKFTNSSELVGLIFSKACETDDAKGERDTAVKDLKAYEGLSIGRVVVDLGPVYAAAQSKAANAELPLKLWVDNLVKQAIENDWV